MFTPYNLKINKRIVIVDRGSDISVFSTYAAVVRLVEQIEDTVIFGATKTSLASLPPKQRLQVFDANDSRLQLACEKSDLVLDFTELKSGLVIESFIAERTEYFHFSKMLGNSSLLQKKIDFLSLHLHRPISIDLKEKLFSASPLLTYDSSMAAKLNMWGLNTIELCYRFRQHGSFLPGSLVIYGDNFALMGKQDLEMIFNIYQQGQIENLFINKPVLEMEWDLLYYQIDRNRAFAATKKYPVSVMETFLDVFFRCFMDSVPQGDANLDRLVQLTKDMDAIDLDETFNFIRGQLNRCLKDIDDKNYPLRGTWWSYVRPYLPFDGSPAMEVSKALRKSIIGLEMFENIYERQRKLLSMH